MEPSKRALRYAEADAAREFKRSGTVFSTSDVYGIACEIEKVLAAQRAGECGQPIFRYWNATKYAPEPKRGQTCVRPVGHEGRHLGRRLS